MQLQCKLPVRSLDVVIVCCLADAEDLVKVFGLPDPIDLNVQGSRLVLD